MIKVVVIPADMNKPLFRAEFEDGDLETMQKLVGGGYIERVSLLNARRTEYFQVGKRRIKMYVDEEGLIKSDTRMNMRATHLYNIVMPWRIVTTHPIMGDAFLVGEDKWGNMRSLPMIGRKDAEIAWLNFADITRAMRAQGD